MTGEVDSPVAGWRGLHLHHAGSHSRLEMPIPQNTGRQPYFAISMPDPKAPTAGPSFSPAVTTPFANPRFPGGMFCAITLEVQGNATDSPMPSSNRNTSSARKPPENPMAIVATDQTSSPAPSTRLAPNLSTHPPTTNCSAV